MPDPSLTRILKEHVEIQLAMKRVDVKESSIGIKRNFQKSCYFHGSEMQIPQRVVANRDSCSLLLTPKQNDRRRWKPGVRGHRTEPRDRCGERRRGNRAEDPARRAHGSERGGRGYRTWPGGRRYRPVSPTTR